MSSPINRARQPKQRGKDFPDLDKKDQDDVKVSPFPKPENTGEIVLPAERRI